ncbi:MAG: ribosome small subunit-dependent GTPase A [Ignavibacteria bacterium]|jgi:ribosome biogenesis GTPase|nr:ribosome small subunit-dependent GTPase A [Ignavibacteria bacterium]MCU7505090.1 ribosome small subunit-dependent GTPase A [Ignavibacteria bacterium]MCU7518078.1 ribosome small subunit-dependent GTPase A [Ignavibacteria bacterium]
MQDLYKLGFNEFFSSGLDMDSYNGFKPARVTSVNKNSYTVSNGSKEAFAEVTGKFLYNSDSSAGMPATGDWVLAQFFDDDSFAVIHEIFPRKSLLKRKTAGKKVEYQIIAANIDTAVIVQALDENYNLRRLERYLVMANECRIKPAVLLSKSDLASPEEVKLKETDIRKIVPGIKIASFSNNISGDVERISSFFEPGKTYCLLGSSGVGKTSLLNNLLNQDLFKTGEIREKDGRGKHTTTRRELIILDNGAVIIDNPGMRELGIISAETGLDETFGEISALAGNCRFNNCTHTVEKGCAVLQAIQEGTLSKERYHNYMKMQKETEFNEMSYTERRQKDKKFGKYVHWYLKHNQKK